MRLQFRPTLYYSGIQIMHTTQRIMEIETPSEDTLSHEMPLTIYPLQQYEEPAVE